MRIFIAILLIVSTANAAPVTPRYKDPSLPVTQRVDDLLARMTMEEKIAQIVGWWDYNERLLVSQGRIFTNEFYARILTNGVGEIGSINMRIEDDVRHYENVQDYFLNHTRLGIPALCHGEGPHGLMRLEATSFPAPIGLACCWNPELVESIYDQVGREARSRGVLHLLSPVVDVVRELRYGRVDEVLSEDPFLVSRLGAAMVRGLQGSSDGTIAPTHVAATLKHFAGYAAIEGGRTFAPYPNGPRFLLDTEIYPFRHIIAAARPAGIMAAYCEIDGLPCHVNRWLLTDVLRKELGFTGLVLSDYNGLKDVRNYQKLGKNDAAVALMAIEAGMQLELPNPSCYKLLPGLIAEKNLDPALIDRAVRAVLDLKFRTGAFESRRLDLALAKALPSSARANKLALEAARESMVLLKNDSHLLPLDQAKKQRIAVIGPNGNVCRLGSYSGTPAKSVTLLEGIRAYLGDPTRVTAAGGCIIAHADTNDSYQNWRYVDDAGFATLEDNRKLIAEAVTVANAADIVILALGETELLGREAWSARHLGDRTTLDLTESQQALAGAILATGKPVILYLMHGKPVCLGSLANRFSTILTGHYAGQETGTAAAEIVFGAVSPSGKLTVSWPLSIGQQPVCYNRHATLNAFPYLDAPLTAVFPFGHGLSYTTFEYSNLKLSADSASPGHSIQVSFDLSNIGNRQGTEIAQLYVSGEDFPVARPQLELKGFARVDLKPGEKRNVNISLAAEDLKFHDSSLNRVLPSGRYLISVGGSSVSRTKTLSLATKP